LNFYKKNTVIFFLILLRANLVRFCIFPSWQANTVVSIVGLQPLSRAQSYDTVPLTVSPHGSREPGRTHHEPLVEILIFDLVWGLDPREHAGPGFHRVKAPVWTAGHAQRLWPSALITR
jgi:hypothetical protein